MDNDNWNPMADQKEKKDRKRIQNRVAQRLYRTRMRQRVEELEKEVNSYRLQAQAQKQQEEDTIGNSSRTNDEDSTLVSGSAINETNAEPGAQGEEPESTSKATITVDIGRQSSSQRTRASNITMGEENCAGPTPVITPGPSPPPHLRILPTAAGCQMQQTSSRSEARGSVVQTQPQSYMPSMSQQRGSPHQSDGLIEALCSPTDMASAAYISPNLLSQAAHSRPANSLTRPAHSPQISNLGTYPLTSYIDFSMTPLNHQGQFSPHSQEWPWSSADASGGNKHTTGGQNEQWDDGRPETHLAPQPPIQRLEGNGGTAGYVVKGGHTGDVAHDQVASDKPNGFVTSGVRCNPIVIPQEGQDVEADMETFYPSASRSPTATDTTDASSQFHSDAGHPRHRRIPSAEAARLEEFYSTLQEALAGVSGKSVTIAGAGGGTRKRSEGRDSNREEHIRDMSLEDRFEFVQRCLSAAGFSGIDSMVGTYYTADFRHDSSIARQQRVSRHSQLPALVAQLRTSARSWSQWEAHGYQSEVMNSAVSLIQDEQKDFVVSKKLFAGAKSELERLGMEDGPVTGLRGGRRYSASPSEAIQLLTKMLQDKVPRLWSMIDELENSDESATHRQRSYTSLAIVLLLGCANRVPSSEVNSLAAGCLSIAQG